MNLNQAFSIVIEFLISEAKNKEYIEKLNTILSEIKNKKHLDQEIHPKHQSILLFGHNMFIFKDEEYLKMAELLQG